ncbi:MAG: hypothetical protein AAGC78_06420 [Cellvibrio sp.]|uniref:hypothetical protein n=1 Tax=Cellvibrio sp. TaxID=1965322 RepID=UPI0031B28453
MNGAIFLSLLVFWGFVCYRFCFLIFGKIKSLYFKRIISAIFLIFMFFLPVIDEVFGAIKFNALCNEKLFLKYDKDFSFVKNVFSDGAKESLINGVPIDIFEKVSSFKDVKTGAVVIEWNSLRADGGKLSKMLNLFQSNKPYVFEGYCISSEWKKTIFSDLNINVEYR